MTTTTDTPSHPMLHGATTMTVAAMQPASGPIGATVAPARKPLRIWPISDLHIGKSEGWGAGQIPAADVAIVAGDICEGVVAAVEWLALHIRPHMPVIFTPGNHEFYGTMHDHALQRGKQAATLADVKLLDGDAVTIGGVRFIGATLWTNYLMFGEPYRWACMQAARQGLNDHRHIAWSKAPWRRFRPDEAAVLHQRAKLDIESHLVQRHDGPIVVVTHHAPHLHSIHRDHRAALLSAAYASDLSELITRAGPNLWVHGHTHLAVDYTIANTRIISNPRGYRHEHHATGFDPHLVLEV
ncbi:MAG: metallophosphoesterase [Bosea sp.]|nr:metallophosphoesterase [Bosea sp. (in: a-proteobacteria)]